MGRLPAPPSWHVRKGYRPGRTERKRTLTTRSHPSGKVTDLPWVGTIAPGYEASFITHSDDIFQVDPNVIIDLQVTGTWIRGARVCPLS